MDNKYDVLVIGGGPAGLAAATSARKEGASVLLLEREAKLGGILKQCIHDGFGVTRFGEKLSGPEYAYREREAFKKSKADVSLLSFVTDFKKLNPGYEVTFVCPEGIKVIKTQKVILATGCRERSSRGVMICGTNPAGLMTAGQCQYYMNIMGQMPVKNAVILGSGDIGLIMARRITLEGGHVIGVYEAKSTPSGLSRNIAQCLIDYDIPLHLSKTVTRVFGKDRLEAVEISDVDERMRPIAGTEEIIECDSLILSVGLIPENELAKSLEIPLSRFTKGPECDQNLMTCLEGVYTCGNAMHVNDLADYVSESAEIAGTNAAIEQVVDHDIEKVNISKDFGYVVPTMVDFNKSTEKMVFYFRARAIYNKIWLKVYVDDELVFKKFYPVVRPPEMQRVVINMPKKGKIRFELEDKK